MTHIYCNLNTCVLPKQLLWHHFILQSLQRMESPAFILFMISVSRFFVRERTSNEYNYTVREEPVLLTLCLVYK